jgi:thymidylate synthase
VPSTVLGAGNTTVGRKRKTKPEKILYELQWRQEDRKQNKQVDQIKYGLF